MSGWIFQGNPKRFDVDRYLRDKSRSGESLVWTCRPKRNVQPGERCFIWRSDGNRSGTGGVVALGEAMSEPEFRADDAPGLWAPGDDHAANAGWRVPIRLIESPRLTAEDGMVLRVELEGDQVLGRLQILHFRALTVCGLTEQEADELERRWESRRHPTEKN